MLVKGGELFGVDRITLWHPYEKLELAEDEVGKLIESIRKLTWILKVSA